MRNNTFNTRDYFNVVKASVVLDAKASTFSQAGNVCHEFDIVTRDGGSVHHTKVTLDVHGIRVNISNYNAADMNENVFDMFISCSMQEMTDDEKTYWDDVIRMLMRKTSVYFESLSAK